ncbi:hypothetical protein SCLCIDRAFT_12343 [Scleroderma citrinum Foug A]|uniref:Uncharacterized protein n=1 Tax=Scleroderma citrinum Foug A TaxID=1036808 RepID=A0A0C2ZBK1_9AGAM|nr:hypothetical protein SCLCIDRAFT_12343 [Scleroderma citrinum Foug A]
MWEQEQVFKERENILQQQHEQQQTILQQRYEGICQEVKIQSSQQETAQQHDVQLAELCKQFELNMQSQIEQLQAARTAEIETCVQEEMAKLSATLQAEKERELASIDQHYSWFKSLIKGPTPKHLNAEDTQRESLLTGLQEKRQEAMDMLCPSSQRHSQATRPLSPPSTPTSTLDAIKRIKKSHGVSMWAQLIHINIDDSDLELFEEYEDLREVVALSMTSLMLCQYRGWWMLSPKM